MKDLNITFESPEGKCSLISTKASIGTDNKIWHFAQVLDTAIIGDNNTIGHNVMVAGKIGSGCKIQANTDIWFGVELGDFVFVGPNATFTNDKKPSARNPNGRDKWLNTIIEDDVTIGANATIVCGITIGKGAMIGAGAVVTKNVPAGETWVGNPARKIKSPINKEYKRKDPMDI